MCVYFVAMMCSGRFRLGWAHDVFEFACHMFMHFPCIHTFIYLYFDIDLCWCFSACFSLSLSLSFFLLVALWHLNENSLRPRTLFILGHLLFHFLTPLLLMYDSVMIKPVRNFQRTFHDEAFIWNAKSFYWIFLILTFPLSSTVGVGSHCVASQSLVPLWSYRSFTLTCTDSILQYLILSLVSKVRAL